MLSDGYRLRKQADRYFLKYRRSRSIAVFFRQFSVFQKTEYRYFVSEYVSVFQNIEYNRYKEYRMVSVLLRSIFGTIVSAVFVHPVPWSTTFIRVHDLFIDPACQYCSVMLDASSCCELLWWAVGCSI